MAEGDEDRAQEEPAQPSAKPLVVAILIMTGIATYFLWAREETPMADRATDEHDGGVADVIDTPADDVQSDRPPDGGISDPAVALRPIELSAPDVTRDLASARQGTFTGSVVSTAGGAPIARAELTFSRDGATRSVRTDRLGRFRFAPREAGTYGLALATANGFLPFAPEWGRSPIRFVASPSTRVDGVRITLVPAVSYTVLVVDAAAAPVPGATVHLFGMDRGERALAPLPAEFMTDVEGRATVRAPDGTVVEARHSEHGVGRGVIDGSVQASHSLRIQLSSDADTFGADQTIAGRVVGLNRAAVPNAIVTGRHLTSPGGVANARRLHPRLEAVTGEDGHFMLEGVDPGSYELVVRTDGFARARREVRAGADDVTIIVGPEASVRVRALDDATGEPVAALTVIVHRARGALQTETLAIESAYDPNGTLQIRGLPGGACSVQVASPGYASSAPHVANAGADPEVVEVRLFRGATIRGRVASSEADRALEGARVTLEGHLTEASSAVPIEVSAYTDEHGAFELRGVPAGVRSVVVWADGHHGRLRSGLLVHPNGELDLETVDVTPLEDDEEPGIELAGIGAVLSAEEDVLLIQQVVEGGGALEAGLQPGDAILEIDGVAVGELGFGGSIERIRGPEGTVVTLQVRRSSGIERVAVPRRRIRA